MKYNFFIFLSLIILSSCAVNEKFKPVDGSSYRIPAQEELEEETSIYKGRYVVEASAETGYRKTTGISGAIFGHFSQADYNDVIKNYQKVFVKKLKRDGYNLADIVLLPVAVDEFNVSEAQEAELTETGFTGTKKTDTYKKFKADFKLSFDFLYMGDNPSQNLNRVSGAFKIRLTNIINRDIAKIGGSSENMDFKSVIDIDKPEMEIGQLNAKNLKLSVKQKLAIKEQLVEYLEKSDKSVRDINLNMYIDIPTSDGAYSSILVDSTQMNDSKLLSEIYMGGVYSQLKGSCGAILAKFIKE